jgi:hypothetical protein
MQYFGLEINFRKIPVATIATFLYFTRLATIRLGVPSDLPLTRELAELQGFEGPAQQDIEEFNSHPRIHLVKFRPSGHRVSRDLDIYWKYFVAPRDSLAFTPPERPPTYLAGALTGHWQGSSVVSFLHFAPRS